MKNIKPLTPIRNDGPAEKAYIKAVKEGWNIMPTITTERPIQVKRASIFKTKEEALKYATQTMLKMQESLLVANSKAIKIPTNYQFPPKD